MHMAQKTFSYGTSIITIVALLLVLVILHIFTSPTPAATTSTPSAAKLVSIDTYIKQNISHLSPKPAVLGGTFYVVSVKAINGKGVVVYEDGHNAYTADFTYTSSDRTGYKITSFKIRNS